MRRPLTIAVAQPSCVAHDLAANARAHADIVRAAAARVVVFPELSLTGYELDAAAVATDDAALQLLVDACVATGSVALAGAVVAHCDGAHCRERSIAVLAIDGDGVRVAYRKMWLGGDEVDRMVAGDSPSVLVVDGWRLGLAICKDTGVAQHAADTCERGIDAYVAGVLEHDHERDVQPARAQRIVHDHGVWVAVASCAAPTGGGYTAPAGESSIWSPAGVLLAKAGHGVGEWVSAALIDG